MTQLKLPSLGEGIEKGTVISITVKVGDTISTEQALMEVETDKVVVEVPSDAAGIVAAILVNIGDEINEGTPIIQLEGEEILKEVPITISKVEDTAVMSLVKDPITETKTKEKIVEKPTVNEELKLPSLGEGIEKGTVIAIHVKEGDTIVAEQSLMEVETDKVVVEVPADASGMVSKVLVSIGDEIGEGNPIIILKKDEVEGANIAAAAPIEIVKEDNPNNTSLETKTPKQSAAINNTLNGERKGKFRASPLARKIAREIGIDITQVTLPEGGNRISVQDVKNYSKIRNQNRATVNGVSNVAPKLPDFSKWGTIRKEAMSGIAQATSKNMTTTWSQIPHAWLQEKVDITDLETKRQTHKVQIKEAGGALTITSILVKVMSKALEKFPIFNASLDGSTNEIIYKDYINVGVAVDSDRGLMVPVLRNANEKGMLQISQGLVSLSKSVKEKKIKPEELQGGTFTISNLGGIGTSAIFPLVNHPQAAILGVAASQTEAIWLDGKFEPRLIMPLTIGFDHRIINGADAARFLKYAKELLEDWFLWNM
ncbi:2-oxo acid dehydrogenase subunit E2 [uncultured Croceitalea sp.]|uniref:2-oxo acid dehydrogenase subunit E2 n=1 Tax=uncultured Croceitalea sp. TaxID=1798908 RepID=UPI0033060395